MNFSTEFFFQWTLWIGTVILSLKDSRLKIYVEVYDGIVLILNFVGESWPGQEKLCKLDGSVKIYNSVSA